MVLERLWRRQSKEESFELNDPGAFGSDSYDDCLSCRVLGKHHLKQPLEIVLTVLTIQALRLLFPLVATPILPE